MERRRITHTDRDRVFQRHGYKCIFCGRTEALHLAHRVPVVSGGDSALDNLMTVCPFCELRLDSGQIRGFEFEAFVEKILRNTPRFADVLRDAVLPDSNFSFDIIATESGERLVIECRAALVFVRDRFLDVVSQLDKYSRHAPSSKVILATLGELTEEQSQLIDQRGYVHWGPRFFAETFSDQLAELSDDFVANFIKYTVSNESRESGISSFQQQLQECLPGSEHWLVYQRLIGRILETLFVPPLEKSIQESSDQEKVNRRDFILPNYCTDGFWAFMREQYSADYIVVDAKNYSSEIKKKEVLQIANYLKERGTGLFGMIFSRNGASSSARHTIREQWSIYRKLIVVLNDEDLKAMLSASSSGGNPDIIIRQKIEEFRLHI